jgi:hypothetical protein
MNLLTVNKFTIFIVVIEFDKIETVRLIEIVDVVVPKELKEL